MVETINVEKAKEKAAEKAIERVYDAEVIGVGTGSTVLKVLEKMSRERDVFKRKTYLASSYDTMIKLSKLGFKVVPSYFTSIKPEIYIDGADEVDKNLNMVKGRGAALLMEKILAYFSKKAIFIVDYTKLVNVLGSKKPIPVEVIPYAASYVYEELKKMSLNPKIRYAKIGKDGPIVTDLGNIIIDLYVKAIDPSGLELKLKSIPGVVETGLFVNLADEIIVGYPDRVEVLRR